MGVALQRQAWETPMEFSESLKFLFYKEETPTEFFVTYLTTYY
jgi:hypothetical protein